MDIYVLKSRYEGKHPHGHFFDADTLKFFGERLSEMRVLKGTVKIKDICNEEHECYVVSSYQRKCPSGPCRAYHYFDVETYDHIIK